MAPTAQHGAPPHPVTNTYQQQQLTAAGHTASLRLLHNHIHQQPHKSHSSADDLPSDSAKSHSRHRRGVSHGGALLQGPDAAQPAAATNKPMRPGSKSLYGDESTSVDALKQASLLLSAQRLRAAAASASRRPSIFDALSPVTEQRDLTGSAASVSFDKTLGNDLTDEEAFTILKELSVSEPHLHACQFTNAELHELCAIFTILKIEQGETVMKVGESASFFALVLQGSCMATVNASIGSLPLPRGSWLGEMSFFEQGVRSAAVTAAQSSVLAMMTYKELDALLPASPLIYAKLLKLLAVVSITKLHERIAAMQSASAKQGNAPSSDNTKSRSPSHHSRKLSTSWALPPPADLVARSSSEPKALPAGIPFGVNKGNTAVLSSRSFHLSAVAANEGTATPLPGSASTQPETLLRKRLAVTLQIRPNMIWRDFSAAEFASAEDSVAPSETHSRIRKTSTEDLQEQARRNDTTNQLLLLHPSIDTLKQLDHPQQLAIWEHYHVHRAAKGLQPDELRALSRDLIEVVLRNYVRWLRKSLQSTKKKPVTDADLQLIVDAEREYLLPGKKGQTDAQAIQAMARQLTGQMTASRAGSTSQSALKGSIPTVTQELFCRSFGKAVAELLQIKTKDPSLGCSIQ